MLHSTLAYEIKIGNFVYSEYAKNPQITSQELQKSIKKLLFEDELNFHIKQYQEAHNLINDKFREDLKKLEDDRQRQQVINLNKMNNLSDIPPEVVHETKVLNLKIEVFYRKLHLIEEYREQTKQTASKDGFDNDQQYINFSNKLKDQDQIIKPFLEKLEQNLNNIRQQHYIGGNQNTLNQGIP